MLPVVLPRTVAELLSQDLFWPMQRLIVLWAEVIDALTFLSRLPLPRPTGPQAQRSASAFLRFAPLAGLVVAGLGSAVLAIATTLHVSSLAAGALATATMILATGALHEDGLADVADGFGGGRTRDAKLAIMRDSRIGTYGAAALGLDLLLRSACLSAVIDHGGPRPAAAALVLAAVLSRGCMLLPMVCLGPARADGLARAVGTLSIADLVVAVVLALGIAGAVAWLAALPWSSTVLTAALAASAATAMTVLARRQIGGVTGDVVGATQQLAEVAALLALSAWR